MQLKWQKIGLEVPKMGEHHEAPSAPPPEFMERMNRVLTAVSLKEPDRVPITPMSIYYAAVVSGLSKKEAMSEPMKFATAQKEVFAPLNFDMVPPMLGVFPSRVWDALDTQTFKWPGAEKEEHRLPDEIHFQWVEDEYMKAEEYDEFLADPTGFSLQKMLGRHHKNLAGFQMFPDVINLVHSYGSFMSLPAFFGPPNIPMLEAIKKAGMAMGNYMQANQWYIMEMMKLGFPTSFDLFQQAPYDVWSESVRGMTGIMMDMYRHPEELKAALWKLVPTAIKSTVIMSKMMPTKNPIIFIPLHRGADGFMSDEQFAEFYWPTLTAIMEGFIKEGLIPCPFYEGGYNERLDFLADFAMKHPAKMIYWFDRTDIIHAKEVFGDYATIRGNIPGSLMATGTPEQMDAYVKKIIEGCKAGGGLIIDGGVSGIVDEAKPENVKAMVDAVFKYGKY
jgi:uroporphyrinogen-III decarboxylase